MPRHVRKGDTVMITAGVTPVAFSMRRLSVAAEASGSTGRSETVPTRSTLEPSTPALAPIRPCFVSQMTTP